MKKISLFILLTLPVCLFAQQPIFPLFAQNPRWRIESTNYNGSTQLTSRLNEYFYQKDTIVEGKTYSKLMKKFNNETPRFEALIRNEGKKTFIRHFIDRPNRPFSSEFGLYDFSLKQRFDEFTFGPIYYTQPLDSIGVAEFVSADSTTISGVKYKRIKVKFSINPNLPSSQTMEWIEGFGLFAVPFYPLNNCFFCADVKYYVMCLEMNGTTIYRDTVRYPNCAPIRVATNDLQKVKINISPNPVDAIIHLENVDNVDKIQLYSFDGRLIQRFEQDDLSKISVAHLPNGIYFMTFYGKNTLFDVRKIVKM